MNDPFKYHIPTHWGNGACLTPQEKAWVRSVRFAGCRCEYPTITLAPANQGVPFCAGCKRRGLVPGFEGSQGPHIGENSLPHVYARSTGSGAGNCVCGRSLGDWLHTEAAPGVPIPERLRPLFGRGPVTSDGMHDLTLWAADH